MMEREDYIYEYIELVSKAISIGEMVLAEAEDSEVEANINGLANIEDLNDVMRDLIKKVRRNY